MLMGPPSCQQEVSISQCFSCNRKHLSPFITLVGLPFLVFTLPSFSLMLWQRQISLLASGLATLMSSHTKAFAVVLIQKTFCSIVPWPTRPPRLRMYLSRSLALFHIFKVYGNIIEQLEAHWDYTYAVRCGVDLHFKRDKKMSISLSVPWSSGDSSSKGCEIKSQHCILDGYLFTIISCKSCNICLKKTKKLKGDRGWPIFITNIWCRNQVLRCMPHHQMQQVWTAN